MQTFFTRVSSAYSTLFSLAELHTSSVAQVIFGTLVVLEGLIFYPIFFKNVAAVSSFASNDFVCWPFFPTCGSWYVLTSPPIGYSYTALFSCLFLLLSVAIGALFTRRTTLAHISFGIALCIEGILLFVLSFNIAYAHVYLHFFLSVLVLTFPYKIHIARLSVIALYCGAGVIGIYQLYVGSLYTLPLLSPLLSTLSTAAVIFIELIGVWFLWSNNSKQRRFILCALLGAHLYGSIVFGWHEFEYFICAAPLLLALFWDTEDTSKKVPFALSVVILACIASGQFVAFKLMSDSNIFVLRPHLGVALSNRTASCTGSITVIREAAISTATKGTEWKNCQCSPYTRAFEAKQICAREKNIKAVSLSMHCTGDFGAPLSFEIPDVCTAPTPSFFGDLGQVLLEEKSVVQH